MAYVDIPGVGRKNFPDSMSDEQILAQAEAIRAKISQPEQPARPMFDPRDLPLSSMLKGGFSRGLEGLKGTAFDLIPALGASMIGQKDYATGQLKEYKDRMAAAELESPTAYKSYKDVGGFGDALGFATETIGEVGPDILAFLSGAGIAGAVGKRIAVAGTKKALETGLPEHIAKRSLAEEAAKNLETRVLDKAARAGASAGQTTGIWGTSLGLSVPETLNSIYENTGKLEPGIALTFGSLKAALDTYLPTKVLKQLGPAGKDRIAAAMLDKSTVVPVNWKKAFGTELLKTAGGEGLTESVQEAIDILASQVAGDKNPFFSQKNIDNIITAFLKGAVGGTAYGTPGAMLEAARTKKAAADEIEKRKPEAEQPPAEQPPPPPLQLTGQQPFTPVVFPDGSVATTPEQVKAYEDAQFARKFAHQPGSQPTPEELAAEQTRRQTDAGAPISSAQDSAGAFKGVKPIPAPPLFPELPELYAPTEKGEPTLAVPVMTKTALQKLGVPKAAPVAKRLEGLSLDTPENINTVVTQLAQFAANPAVKPEVKTKVLDFLTTLQQPRNEQQGALQFAPEAPSGVGFTNEPYVQNTQLQGQLAAAQQSQEQEAAYQQRQAEEDAQKEADLEKLSNVAGAQRQLDMIEPEQAAPEIQQEELTREPEQPSLPGTGVRYGDKLRPQEVIEEPAAPELVTPDMLTTLGVLPAAPIRKRLVGKDLSDPTQRAQVQRELAAYAENKNVPAKVRKGIDKFLNSTVFMGQTEMFGPKGGVTAAGRAKDITNAEPIVEASGEGVSVSDEQGAGPAGGTTESGLGGLAESSAATGTSGMGEGTQPTALSAEDQAALQAELDAELGQETEFTAEDQTEPNTESEQESNLLALPVDMAFGYGSRPEINNENDIAKVVNLLNTQVTEPNAKAAQIYFGKLPNVVDNLLNVGFDIAFDSPTFRQEEESAAEAEFMSGMNGKNARAVAIWANDNLSQETNNILREFIKNYARSRANVSDAQLMALIKSGVTGSSNFALDETVKDYIKKQQVENNKLLGAETIEGEYSVVIDEQAVRMLEKADDKLSKKETATLEEHFGAKRGTDEYTSKLREQVLLYINKGAAAISSVIRDIVRKLAAIILLTGVAFNTTDFNREAQAVNIQLPTSAQQFVYTAENPRADFGKIEASVTASIVGDWVVGSGNNNGKPFTIVDKGGATMYVFNADGKLLGAAPVLLGAAKGDYLSDEARNKSLDQTLPEDKITPAGRFEGKLAKSREYGTTIDFLRGDNAYYAIHQVYLGTPSEKRQQRLNTETVEDNRISYGCVNIGKDFYFNVIEKNFQNGGIVYITPDNQSLEQTFKGIAGYTAKQQVVTKNIYNPFSEAQVKAYTEQVKQKPVVPTPTANKNLSILGSALSKLDSALHPMVVAMLETGNLQSALRVLAGSADPFIAKTAQRFANVSPNTKVILQDNLRDESGQPVPGFYDPRTDTVYLDSVTGLNSHVLLHEVGHSVMSHTLDNPSHPLTRQLQQILDKVKGSLDTAYGATNVQEFAAEAWSNKAFKAKLRSINPNGGPITAWDMFSRSVINFFRRMMGLESKPLDSAYDQVDRILEEIVSPAPNTRDSGVLYAPKVKKAEMVFGRVDKIINDIPYLGESQRNILSNAIAKGSNFFRFSTLSLMPQHALSDIAKSVFGELSTRFNELIDKRSGYEDGLNRGTDAAVAEAKAAYKSNPKQYEKFAKVVNESTVNEVDPTNSRDVYSKYSLTYNVLDSKGKFVKKEVKYFDTFDARKAAIDALNKTPSSTRSKAKRFSDPDAEKSQKWDELNAQYKKLDKPYQDLYVTMRDGYKEMYEQVKDAIKTRIDSTSLDTETKESLKSDIMEKLAASGTKSPYFGLGREGDYWLASEYIDQEGQKQLTVEAFKSPRERTLRRQEHLKNKATRSDEYRTLDEVDYSRAPTGSFVNSVLRVMETNKVDQPVIDEMMRLFISTLPETAFAKSFQKRNNTAGYSEDVIGVFERKMRNTGHQVANMRFNPQLTNVIDQMQEQTRVAGRSPNGNELEAQYLNQFKRRLSYVLNPTKNDLGSILTSAAFTATLGFNISSVVVNALNIPMVVAPYLNGQYGDADVMGAIGAASRTFMGSGTTTEMEVIGADGRKTKMKVMPSLTNYAPDSEIGKKYATLIQVGNERGQFNRSQLYEMINGDTRTGFLAKFNALSGWMFHHGERMNREVSLMATYDLEMGKLAKDVKSKKISQREAEIKAANHAIYTTELTNGGIAAASAPLFAQNSVGKAMFMYKRYGISMYYMLAKTGKDAIFNSDLSPAEKKAAWKQMGGIFGMSALMAGVQGIPMYGAVSLIYSMFCDDDDDDLDTVTRKGLGEFMFKGPLDYMTNLAAAGRITLNDLIVRDTKSGTSSATFSQQLIQALGGPVVGVADKMQRGYNKIAEGHTMRGIEDMLPVAAGNVLKAFRYATEGTTTLRGDPITGDVSTWNVIAQAFGFAPADYTRQLEINAQEKGVEKYINQTSTKLKQKYYMAKRVGDFEGMAEMKEKLLELGAKHPAFEINNRTINDVLDRSIKAQERATKEMVNGVRYSKKGLKEVKEHMREYDD